MSKDKQAVKPAFMFFMVKSICLFSYYYPSSSCFLRKIFTKFRRRVARGNLTSAQLRCLGISSASASPCSMLIQHRFAFLNLRPSLRIDESQEELSVPQGGTRKQNIVSLYLPPAARRPWSNGEALVAKGERHKDGPPGRLTLPGNPGISRFMPFICVHLCHLWITFSCLGFFSWIFVPFVVKVYLNISFGCGYAALSFSW